MQVRGFSILFGVLSFLLLSTQSFADAHTSAGSIDVRVRVRVPDSSEVTLVQLPDENPAEAFRGRLHLVPGDGMRQRALVVEVDTYEIAHAASSANTRRNYRGRGLSTYQVLEHFSWPMDLKFETGRHTTRFTTLESGVNPHSVEAALALLRSRKLPFELELDIVVKDWKDLSWKSAGVENAYLVPLKHQAARVREERSFLQLVESGMKIPVQHAEEVLGRFTYKPCWWELHRMLAQALGK